MKKTALSLFFVVTVIATVGSVIGAGDKSAMENGSETLVVQGGKYGDVPFPHRMHQKNLTDCNVCHQLFPKSKGSILAMQSAGKLKARQVMNQCLDCHRDRRKKGVASGPTSCSGCHQG